MIDMKLQGVLFAVLFGPIFSCCDPIPTVKNRDFSPCVRMI